MGKTKSTRASGARRKLRKAEAKILQAVLHPVRLDILAVLVDRDASANELAEMLGEPCSTVRRHVRVLRESNVIEIVDERLRGGAMERYYRTVVS